MNKIFLNSNNEVIAFIENGGIQNINGGEGLKYGNSLSDSVKEVEFDKISEDIMNKIFFMKYENNEFIILPEINIEDPII